MLSDLEKDIYRVVAYFSYFGYPVTALEIFKWQYQPERVWDLHEIMRTLSESAWLKNKVESCDGFYGISTKSHGDIWRQTRLRHERFLNAAQKYKSLKRILNYLGRLPCIEGIAICNTLAFHHTQERSDIDLFIIAKPEKVWSARFLSVLPFLLLRKRPGETKRDPVDLSFFISRSNMDFEFLKCAENDPYLTIWTRSLIPVHGEAVFEEFFKENKWATNDLPASMSSRRAHAYRVKLNWKFPVIFFPEVLAEFLQRKKFPKDIMQLANKSTDVIVRNDMLKFHKNDRRAEICAYIDKRMRVCSE